MGVLGTGGWLAYTLPTGLVTSPMATLPPVRLLRRVTVRAAENIPLLTFIIEPVARPLCRKLRTSGALGSTLPHKLTLSFLSRRLVRRKQWELAYSFVPLSATIVAFVELAKFDTYLSDP